MNASPRPVSVTDLAIQFAYEHELPLLPRVYEVLYAHFSGSDPRMSGRVEQVRDEPPAKLLEALMAMWEEFFGSGSLHQGLELVSDSLHREMARVEGQLEAGIGSQSRLASELKDGLRELSQSNDRGRLRDIARRMFQSNHDAIGVAHGIGQELTRSHNLLRQARRELEALRESAFSDHLTQLPNRRYMDKLLVDSIAAAQATGRPLTVALLDIDHFKSVNDRWGHAVGDNVLRGTGKLLRQNVKGRDTAGRVGGEEFALILPETAAADAVALGEQIRHAMEEVIWVREQDGKEIGRITLSMGVAEWREGDSPTALMERADAELYRAKGAGRNRICLAA